MNAAGRRLAAVQLDGMKAIAHDAHGQWITRAWCWFRQSDRTFICIPEQV